MSDPTRESGAAPTRRESPKQALARIAAEVKTWPAYLRVHSSAYYERKARRG